MELRPPHCNQRVLHAPEDNCLVCNGHPEWQALRELWGINFTGHADPDKLPCPAEAQRSFEDINRWQGNMALTPDVVKAFEDFKQAATKAVEELVTQERRRHWNRE